MDTEIQVVKEIIKKAVHEILKVSQDALIITDKGKQDIVTQKDFEMERAIKKALKVAFPNDAFIGEEENHEVLTDQRTWVCDPIDGTVNYTLGLPYYGVQMALLENFNPVFCMIYLPELDECYHAAKLKGAFLNNSPIHPNQSRNLASSIVTFGDFSKSNPSSRGYQLQAMTVLMPHALRLRIQGASSVDFAFVAAGKNGCHIMFSKNLWELAPGLMLADEAGCLVHRIDGAKHGFEGTGVIVANNELILNEVLLILEPK